jgi:predicted TIM-barrel fold metal-dependent hydrolase
MTTEEIVSCDDHMDMHVIPPDLFRERVPAALRAQAPRVEDTADGPFWIDDGGPFNPSGRMGPANLPDVFERAGLGPGGFRPSDPHLRLQDMDRDGIRAQVIYGPPMGLPGKDPALKLACVRAYNEWAAEFNATDPNRLCVLAILPTHDPEAAAEELRRAAGLGHRGVMFHWHETKEPAFSPTWWPVWAAAEETGLPLSFHLYPGGHHQVKLGGSGGETVTLVSCSPTQMDELLAGPILCGTLERYPGVRFVLAEGGIGWVPFLIERMDHEFVNFASLLRDTGLKRRPSEVFQQQVWITFQEEHVGLKLLPELGIDRVMWASDFPHPDGTFPHSRKVIAETLGGLDEATRRKLVHDTAAGLYGMG